MQSFLTHMNEKAGINGTIGLYKKDRQGGYTASDDDENNHDCKEEHPGVSHKKWVAASKDEVEEAMNPKEIIRARKAQKRELVRGKRKSGKTSDKLYDLLLRKSQGKPVDVPKNNNQTEEVEWDVAQYWSEDTVSDFLKRGGKITKLPTRGKPRTSRKVKVKGVRPTGKQLSDRAERKMQRSEEVDLKEDAVTSFVKEMRSEGRKAKVYTATGNGGSLKAQFTNKKWEDGVPVTKNLTRGGNKSVKTPRGNFKVIETDTFWYYEINKGWAAVSRQQYNTPPWNQSASTNESKASAGQVMADGKANAREIEKRRIARGETPMTQKNPFHPDYTGTKKPKTIEVSKGHTKTTMEAYHNTLSRMASRTKEVEESMDEAAGDRVLAKKGQYKVLTHDKLGTRLVKGGKEILKGYYDEFVFAGEGGWFMRVKGKEVPFREASDIIKFAEKGMKEGIGEEKDSSDITSRTEYYKNLHAKDKAYHDEKKRKSAAVLKAVRATKKKKKNEEEEYDIDEAIRSKPAKELRARARRVKYAHSPQQKKDTAKRTKKIQDKERKMYGGKSLSDIAKELKTNSVRKVMKHAETLRKEEVDEEIKKNPKFYRTAQDRIKGAKPMTMSDKEVDSFNKRQKLKKAGERYRADLSKTVPAGQPYSKTDAAYKRAKKTSEEYEIEENVAYLKNKEGHTFVVSKRDTKGMRGKQDKFSMSVIDKKGKTVKDWGSHVSVAGAKKFASSRGFSEEVEPIDEGVVVLPKRSSRGGDVVEVGKNKRGSKTEYYWKHKSGLKNVYDSLEKLRYSLRNDANFKDAEEITKQLGEAVSVDGRTKGYRDAISRIAARHKVVVDRDAGPETDPADAPEDLEMPYPDDNLPEAKNQYADGAAVKVVHPQRGKGVVKGKVVRHDKGAMGGSPFYVVAIPGVAQSVKVSDHNMIKENAEETLDEAKASKIMKQIRGQQGPYTVVVMDGKKVIDQHIVKIPTAVPAAVKVARQEHPNTKIAVESGSGQILHTEANRLGFKAGKNPNLRAKDPKDVEMDDFLKDVSAMIGRGAKPDDVRESIHKILPMMKKRGVKVTPQQKAALKKLGIKEGLITTPIVKAAQAAKAGSKHSVKAAAKAGISAYRRGVGDELVKKGQKWHGKDSEARRKSAEKKVGTMTSTSKIRDEEFEIDEDGQSGRTQSNVAKTGTHSSELNYLTRSKKQGWSDRGRSSAKEKKRASKEARQAGKKETEVDEGRLGALVGGALGASAGGIPGAIGGAAAGHMVQNAAGMAATAILKKRLAAKKKKTKLNNEVEVDEAKLRIPKETGTPGMTKARGPKTPYEKSKAFIAAHKRDNKGKYPTQAQHDKAIKEAAAAEKKQTGAQKVIAKYKKRAADAQQWKKDNNKTSTGIEETANVGDKNAPVTSQDMNYLSDFYKDVYGTRPRGTYKHIKTVGDYQKEIKSLSIAAEAEQARVKQDRVDRKKGKATEKKIQKKRTFGPKGGTSKTTLTPAFKKALAKSRSNKRR